MGGKVDLGAQTVEFDIHAVSMDAPASPAWIRIWGPSKQQISQASDYNGATLTITAGMTKGLPLATDEANQAGVLLTGQIFQAFGNWQGINQTLDFVVVTDLGATQVSPAKLSFTWQQGQPLADMIKTVLSAAYPSSRLVINISPRLVLTNQEAGVYSTMEQFATYVKGVSQNIMGGDYPGVSIVPGNGVINVFDNTAPAGAATQINVQDLIGQVTWLDAFTIQFSTVLRADLAVGALVTLPPVAGAQAVTTPGSGSNVRAQNTFSGTWTVSYMRHVGNSRAPDAQSWITTFQAYSNTASPASQSTGNTSA